MSIDNETVWWDQRKESGVGLDGYRSSIWTDSNSGVCVLNHHKTFYYMLNAISYLEFILCIFLRLADRLTGRPVDWSSKI